MSKILNILSVIGSFMVVFGLLFMIQDYTLGQIPGFREIITLKIFRLKDLVFTATSLFFILKFINFYLPDRGHN